MAIEDTVGKGPGHPKLLDSLGVDLSHWAIVVGVIRPARHYPILVAFGEID